MHGHKESIAKILLSKGAVTLNPTQPYEFTSGILSPIYCDNRILISYPDTRKEIVDSFLKILKENNIQFDIVAGVSTSGIPWAAWIAEKLDKPMVYVRIEAKGHGKENKIEGRIEKNKTAIVVEDLISTGGSSLAVADAIKEAGLKVGCCLAIFDYEMEKAKKGFSEKGCSLFSLTDFSTLVKVAVKEKYIKQEEEKLVLDWSKNPDTWGVK